VALSYRSSSSAQSATSVSTLTPPLPTGSTTNDLVYICGSVNAVYTAPVDPIGWTVRHDTNSDATGRTFFAYKTLQVGDTAPSFSWTTGGKTAWTAICVQPAVGQQAAHSGLATPTINATNTSHTSPAFAAGAATGCSILMTGYREGANGATGVTTTPPTSWTEGTAPDGDVTTAAGTTAALRQVSSWHAYRTGQTGTITPTAQTVTLTSVANLYHAFAVEQVAPTLVTTPVPVAVFNSAAIQRAHYF
jgi:hypothetical protein